MCRDPNKFSYKKVDYCLNEGVLENLLRHARKLIRNYGCSYIVIIENGEVIFEDSASPCGFESDAVCTLHQRILKSIGLRKVQLLQLTPTS